MAKSVASKNAVATKSEHLPDYLRDYKGGQGLQSMGADDLVIPRIKLLQGMSQEPQTFEEAKSGDFWHNVLNVSLGAEFKFIVCSDRRRYLLTAPMNGEPEGILARADDGVHWRPANTEFVVKLDKKRKETVTWRTALTVRESGLANFGASDPSNPQSHPAATLFYDYLCYLPDHPELSPVIISLARSQINRGKDLNAKIELRAGRQPMQSMIFKAVSVTEKGAQGPYSNYQFQSAGNATEEQYQAVMRLKERFGTYKVADEEGALRGEEPVQQDEKAF